MIDKDKKKISVHNSQSDWTKNYPLLKLVYCTNLVKWGKVSNICMWNILTSSNGL